MPVFDDLKRKVRNEEFKRHLKHFEHKLQSLDHDKLDWTIHQIPTEDPPSYTEATAEQAAQHRDEGQEKNQARTLDTSVFSTIQGKVSYLTSNTFLTKNRSDLAGTNKVDVISLNRLQTLNSFREERIVDLSTRLLKYEQSLVPDMSSRRSLLKHIVTAEKGIADIHEYYSVRCCGGAGTTSRLNRRIEACRDILGLMPDESVSDEQMTRELQVEIDPPNAVE